MTALRDRLLEVALQATVLVAGVMLVHGIARGENGGCTNNTCKDINTWRICLISGDNVWKYITCLHCKSSGRCDTGAVNQRPCNLQTQLQKLKAITSTEICSCAQAPANGYAERTGTYTDDNWTDSTVKQWLCGSS
jgi:hypothetical protein